MKKLFSAILVMAMLVTVFTSCGKTNVSDTAKTPEGFSVVTTIFPEYDWVREIIKGNDNIELIQLLDSGVDLHSFQPTADDIVTISNCDMFIYVGGESDEWVENALAEAVNEDMIVLNLLDAVGDLAKEEEIIEGMEEDGHDHEHEDANHEEEHEDANHEEEHEAAEHEEEHHDDVDHEDEPQEEHEHEGSVYDEHIWLSLKNAKVLCQIISDEISKMDPENTSLYNENVTKYIEELNSIDQEYEKTVGASSINTLLFGDRFPFRYLVDDYDLDYYAAFSGCSAETEASFETIAFLANKMDELNLPVILQIETADGKIAQTLKDTTKAKNQQILTMDSMQSVTKEDVKGGVTYIGIMKDNLTVLEQAIR